VPARVSYVRIHQYPMWIAAKPMAEITPPITTSNDRVRHLDVGSFFLISYGL